MSYMKHSRLSPSAAKRWATCSASVGYIAANTERLPEENESSYALEGTIAHEYAEEVLTGLITLDEVPEDIRPFIKTYVDECMSHVRIDGEMYVEERVPLFYRPTDKGTCDFAHVTEERIVIRDYKHGAGVLVRAEGNEQLAIYALSFVLDLYPLYGFSDDVEVSIGIVQPRYVGEEPISVWETTVGELRTFCQRLSDTAEAIQRAEDTVSFEEAVETGLVSFAPSEEACRWCPAKGFCPSRANLALGVLPDITSPMSGKSEPADLDSLSDADLVNIYRNTKAITSFLKDVEEYMLQLALQGEAIEGTKVVKGRKGNTQWANNEEALRYLAGQGLKQDERYKITPITPTQAQKLLAEKLKNPRIRKNFERKTFRAEGKLTLALSSDKREGVSCGTDLADAILTNKVDDMLR